MTVVLGLTFLWLQGYEYLHAYRDLGLRFDSGIYGNTFFILTGSTVCMSCWAPSS